MNDGRSKYEITAYIGKGGMGQVFRGVSHGENGFRRDVAIKRLRSSMALDDEAQQKFLREALISASLDHPNIVSVFDYAKDNSGHLCLIMAYVDGIDLHEVMEAQRLPIAVVLHIIDSVLRGLAYAHERGIIHRDIKPANVMVSRVGTVQLTDFGLARPMDDSRPPSYGGTPGFMSPEALQTSLLDPRSDLFSVGVMLYELLTGTRPFPGDKPMERIANTLTKRPRSPIELCPDIPETLSKIAMRLLASEPSQRFQSALEVRDALPQSRHASEDLAAIVKELAPTGASAGLSSEDERSTEQFRRKIGDTLWGEANDGNTVIIPEPVPEPISCDPEVAVQVSDSSDSEGEPRRVTVPTERRPADARPAILSIPEAKPAEGAEGAERAERAPSAPEPDRPARPLRTVHIALAAAAALIVLAVLGQRALRHGEPSEHVAAPRAVPSAEPSTSPEPAHEPERGDVAQAPEVTRAPATARADERTQGEEASERGPADTQDKPAHKPAQDKPRKVKHRPPRSKKPLLPSQQNREIHIVPKADIYKQIEEEE